MEGGLVLLAWRASVPETDRFVQNTVIIFFFFNNRSPDVFIFAELIVWCPDSLLSQKGCDTFLEDKIGHFLLE